METTPQERPSGITTAARRHSSSANCTTRSVLTPSVTTQNSSPPMRAARAPGRWEVRLDSSAPNVVISRSPASCPSVSLTVFRPLMSTRTRATSTPSSACRATAASSRSSRARRFPRPVRGSENASCSTRATCSAWTTPGSRLRRHGLGEVEVGHGVRRVLPASRGEQLPPHPTLGADRHQHRAAASPASQHLDECRVVVGPAPAGPHHDAALLAQQPAHQR